MKDPVFPTMVASQFSEPPHSAEFPCIPEGFQPVGGLTKRELFAAMAMQGIMANPTGPNHDFEFADEPWYDIESAKSVKVADALIKALAK